MSGRVMLVGWAAPDRKRIEKIFRSVGVPCDVLPSIDAALEKLPANPPTVVLAQRPMDPDALPMLRETLQRHAPATPFLVGIASSDMNAALEVMRAGAYDCIAAPYQKFHVLAAAKRAAAVNGRTLFVPKIKPRRRHDGAKALAFLTFFVVTGGFIKIQNGAPPPVLDLGSATLSGLDWHDRTVWVADWFESTVTRYHVKRGPRARDRGLLPDETMRFADLKPILICGTPDGPVTVGFDLRLRTHRPIPGWPVVRTRPVPGTNPTGLVWFRDALWSVDGQTGSLYRHDDQLDVAETIRSILPSPQGLATDGKALWVVGGSPVKVARLVPAGAGWVWQGPYPLGDLVADGVIPSGIAIGFDRLWAVSGGDPRMLSKPLSTWSGIPPGWRPHAPAPVGKP